MVVSKETYYSVLLIIFTISTVIMYILFTNETRV